MANFADSNRASIKIIQESNSAWGVTPSSGSSREIRLTSSSLAATKETTVSDELRSDRMVSTVVEVSASTGGDINYEFSAGSQDDFFQAFLASSWSRPMTFDKFEGTAVSWATTSRLDIAGQDVTSYFTVGRRVRTSGFVNSANNDYWQIASVAFTSGNTQITMTATTAVIESGSTYTKIQDANDVIILKDTTIRSGTSGASTFDSNGNNAFSTAITAGQLVSGQKIYVDGLGYEEGTYTHGVQPSDAETVTVSDGVKTVTFEYDSNSSVTSPNIAVVIGGTTTVTATNLAEAINNQFLLGNLDASATSATTVTTVRNLNKTGGTLTENTAAIAVVNFSGGDASASGVFTIVTAANDTLTVTPSPGTINNSTVSVTVKGSMLRNPNDNGSLPHQLIVPQSFSIETLFNDVSQYLIHDGMRVGAFSQDVASGSITTGTFTFMGKQTQRNSTSVLGNSPYTVLKSTETEVMNATTNVGAITKDGVALSTAVQSISLSGDSSLRAQNVIGSKFPAGIGTGRFNLTGTVTAYFEDGARYDDFLAHTTLGLSWPFTDLEKNSYHFTLPALKFTADPVAPSGIDSDIIETLEFVAFRDPATETQFQLDRFSNIDPVQVS